jgi:superfamily II DNA or RNA helicase
MLRSPIRRGVAGDRSSMPVSFVREASRTTHLGRGIVQPAASIRHQSTAAALDNTALSPRRPHNGSLAEGGREFALRPYQSEALKVCALALDAGDGRIGVGMPTNSGRTVV